MSQVKLFSGSGSIDLAEKIAQSFGKPLGNSVFQKFSDGEMAPYFEESVRGCDVFIIQSTFAPADNILELLLMVDAAKRASAESITLVVPYFGYARQDRKDKSRVAIGAKLIANLIEASGASRLIPAFWIECALCTKTLTLIVSPKCMLEVTACRVNLSQIVSN